MNQHVMKFCGRCLRPFESRLGSNICDDCISAEHDEELFEGYDDCQHCGRAFDEIDHEYQICSFCLYDSETKKFTKGKPRPQWEL